MDTDYLTQSAYECILLAGQATDVLRSELGAACSQFRNEDDYLRGILMYVKEIAEDPEDYLDSWNLMDTTDVAVFVERLAILRKRIEKVLNTPNDQRGPKGVEE